ncbi:MAG: DeoR/GlpR family DNA-binding transcription regulator [Pseudomonadales bacterium]|nr:DeoR/GlpR family DNA-binding transcription regulator [Pseudomonadales bacterium]NRA13988.1 DeoR/GlpR transcriptional regulator [Oceanospirillaceae bacterium]
MKLNSRQQQILQLISAEQFVSVEFLTQHFQVAAQTVRRDITQLCDLGLARRHHGGAGQLPSAENLSFGNRRIINANAKQLIALRIAAQIPDNASLALGIGTTIEAVAKALLNKKGLRIITNNLNVASIFFQTSDAQVLVSGGKLRPLDQDLVGDQVVSFYNSYYTDFAIISVGALDQQRGLMDFDMDNVAITQSILKNCRKNILAADDSKWNKKAFASVATFTSIDAFYTNQLPAPDICQSLESKKVQIIVCDQEKH